MADDGPRCELLYPENTRECTHEKGALSRGRGDTRIEIKFTTRVWGGWRDGRDGSVMVGVNRVCARRTVATVIAGPVAPANLAEGSLRWILIAARRRIPSAFERFKEKWWGGSASDGGIERDGE